MPDRPVLLGVSGGVAAYKACELVRELQQRGHRVQVILTRGGSRFVSPLTFAALTGEPVLTRLFAAPGGQGREASESSIEHIALAQSAAALVVAPATAHVLAKFAHGLADDLLSTVYLATTAPVVLAPAMNVNMWQHPATQANLDLLRQRPATTIVAPDAGYLACGMVGEGRLAERAAIADAVEQVLAGAPPRLPASPASSPLWRGQTVLITAGPTREALDPVRYFSNRSSGRMGFALARAAARHGAHVVLIAGPTPVPPPSDPAIEVVAVTTAEEMAAAVFARFDRCDAAILAAAVADYRPAHAALAKLKKNSQPLRLELVPTTDILAELGRRKSGQLLAGFAAETGDPVPAARAKLAAKNADLMVANDVTLPGTGFDAGDNAVVLVSAAGELPIVRASKDRIAEQILQALAGLRRPVPVGS
ncbi:MAG: bifunctional phosphopantothenoylcysteine decarboxylase/phosphopantothenate--cysteine ligase CoaBC [Terriglobales bacterium]